MIYLYNFQCIKRLVTFCVNVCTRDCLLQSALLSRVALAILGLALLSGCASIQGDGSRSSADPVIDVERAQLEDNLPLIDISDLSGSGANALPVDTNRDRVRWGGTIAGIENREDGSTLVEIVSRPLRNRGRPIHNDTSSGRFYALIDRFLDPEIVVQGRDMTVEGELIGLAQGFVGDTPYIFPSITVDDYKYWQKNSANQRPRLSIHDQIYHQHPGFPHSWPHHHGHGPSYFGIGATIRLH